ncbi:hypothetical protein T12_10328 [Trichinella patagoniensis]|uniref:Uncharacterized protein n=1 Tax=Trichinella patagoniensis TaxID=990121 RepID=A0A0V0ZI17_9BILA|nr:hypothetical protein T12_10328 [Trichinella patagoniensis]
MVRPDGSIPPGEFVIKVMLVNWVVNADFYLLASYSLPVYMNYNINLQWNEHRAVSTALQLSNCLKETYRCVLHCSKFASEIKKFPNTSKHQKICHYMGNVMLIRLQKTHN